MTPSRISDGIGIAMKIYLCTSTRNQFVKIQASTHPNKGLYLPITELPISESFDCALAPLCPRAEATVRSSLFVSLRRPAVPAVTALALRSKQIRAFCTLSCFVASEPKDDATTVHPIFQHLFAFGGHKVKYNYSIARHEALPCQHRPRGGPFVIGGIFASRSTRPCFQPLHGQ